MKTFYIKTFGCQMNKHDSERLTGLLLSHGFRLASPEEAEILIFNTCSVRKTAEQKFAGVLNYWQKMKAQNGVLIGVGGCTAQKEGEKLIKKLPGISFIFGPNDLEKVPQLIDNCLQGNTPQISAEIENQVDFSSLPLHREERFRAWVSISTGCNNFCSYCIVPYVRGKERSRSMEEILEEVRRLVADGAIEITLLGQNVNSYGRDLYGQPRFGDLLKAVEKTPGLKRLRFTTSHPRDFSFDLIEIIKNSSVICPHFHLPLQAGSNRILELMNRGYTQEDYLSLTQKIREEIPEASITTDLIVGFPGEKEEDFKETLKVAEKVQFDQAFTFLYSPREGTKAAEMKDIVPLRDKKEWFLELVKLTKKTALERNKLLLNRVLPVLIDGKSKKGQVSGRTTTNKVVNLQGGFSSSSNFPDECFGKIFDVKITSAFPFHLKGKILLD